MAFKRSLGGFGRRCAQKKYASKSTGICLPILLAAGYVFVKGKRGNFSQTHA